MLSGVTKFFNFEALIAPKQSSKTQIAANAESPIEEADVSVKQRSEPTPPIQKTEISAKQQPTLTTPIRNESLRASVEEKFSELRARAKSEDRMARSAERTSAREPMAPRSAGRS